MVCLVYFFISTCWTDKLIFGLEIDPEVDFDSRRAVYFRQMRYGLFVSDIRMYVRLIR